MEELEYVCAFSVYHWKDLDEQDLMKFLFGKIWIQNVRDVDFWEMLNFKVILKIQRNSPKNQVLEEKIKVEDVATLGANGTTGRTKYQRRGNGRIRPRGPRESRGERRDYVTECAFKSYSK